MVEPRLVRALPKADLHSHIDGSIPPRELFRIAARDRRTVTDGSGRELSSPSELIRHTTGAGYGTLLEDIVGRFHPIVGVMQTEEALRNVGVAYVREQSKHNVIYAEGRFAPQYHTREGLTMEDAISAMAEGLAEGSESFGVVTNLIVAIGRESDPKTGTKVVRAAAKSRNVVAIDLGGPEKGNPPQRFVEAYQMAGKLGLGKTVHAGEDAGSRGANLAGIRAAIEVLETDRVGHAIGLAKDPALLELVRAKRVGVETNPVSNLILGNIKSVKELGIDKLLKSDVSVTVNSDDPALWPEGSIDDVLVTTCEGYGFGVEELGSLIRNSISGSFAGTRTKEALLEEFNAEFEKTSK